MTQASPQQWTDLLRESLSDIVEKSESAATGARLNALLLRNASAQDLQPPEEIAKLKFKEWLRTLQEHKHLLVLLRPGEDVLVAPFDRAELLLDYRKKAGRKTNSGIRRDLFDAFTIVNDDKQPW